MGFCLHSIQDYAMLVLNNITRLQQQQQQQEQQQQPQPAAPASRLDGNNNNNNVSTSGASTEKEDLLLKMAAKLLNGTFLHLICAAIPLFFLLLKKSLTFSLFFSFPRRAVPVALLRVSPPQPPGPQLSPHPWVKSEELVSAQGRRKFVKQFGYGHH